MAEGPYVYERQTEYWTSRQIEEHFLNAGFELLTFPLTPISERQVPADFIFFDKSHAKVMGLQYKTLYHNGVDHWWLTDHQHKAMQEHYPWIYYAASELRSTREHRNALHYARFFGSDFPFQKKLPVTPKPVYYRWGPFYQAFVDCKVGQRVSSRTQLQQLLWPNAESAPAFEVTDLVPDVFLADLEARHAVHFSPLLRVDERG